MASRRFNPLRISLTIAVFLSTWRQLGFVRGNSVLFGAMTGQHFQGVE